MSTALLSRALVAVLALLALNAFAYGAFYLLSPGEGVGEFGYDTSGPVEQGALHLVSMVGAGLLGFMGFALLAIALVLRGERSGLAVALVLGATYLGIGIFMALNQLWVDALIYGGFGAAVGLLAGILWKPMRPA